jgi:hypothetical protein
MSPWAEASKLFKITVSFGNTCSLISLPCFMSHASIPADIRAARGLPDDLVRISAGGALTARSDCDGARHVSNCTLYIFIYHTVCRGTRLPVRN